VPLIRDKEEVGEGEGADGGVSSSSRFAPGEQITAAQLGEHFEGDKSMSK
jgi:hypothetical protein